MVLLINSLLKLTVMSTACGAQRVFCVPLSHVIDVPSVRAALNRCEIGLQHQRFTVFTQFENFLQLKYSLTVTLVTAIWYKAIWLQ